MRALLFAISLVGSSAAFAEDLPVGRFNHSYIVVDQETADAIGRSPELAEFAHLEILETKTTDGGWFGRYLRGRQTYVEFFGPTDQTQGKTVAVGSVGLAISGDRVGDLAIIAARMKAAGAKVETEVVKRPHGAGTIDWFSVASIASPLTQHDKWPPKGPFVIGWSMEHFPAYLDLPESKKEPAEGPDDVISRERYLSDAYKTKLLRDVSRLDIALTEMMFRSEVAPYLRAGGFVIKESPKSASAESDGVTLAFTFVPPDQVGIRYIEFVLNRDVPTRKLQIGHSMLEIGGTKARWTFAASLPGDGTPSPPMP